MPILSTNALDKLRRVSGLHLPDSCTFKLKDGTKPSGGGPFNCRVSKHTASSSEQAEGGRTTALELFDLILPNGTAVQPFWRVEVTFAGASSAITYLVKDAGSPNSNELTRTVVIERVR